MLINNEIPLLDIVTSSQDVNNCHGEASSEAKDSMESPQNITPRHDINGWRDGDGDPCPMCGQPYK